MSPPGIGGGGFSSTRRGSSCAVILLRHFLRRFRFLNFLHLPLASATNSVSRGSASRPSVPPSRLLSAPRRDDPASQLLTIASKRSASMQSLLCDGPRPRAAGPPP